jgi:hypothetical protein
MTALTLDDLRAIARAQRLDLTDDELAGLLPLVQAGRELVAALDAAVGAGVEPTALYGID